MAESKQDIAALRQEIRAQRERLIDEKIEKGLAVRAPVTVVAALDPEGDYDAVYRDADGIEHYPPEDIAVIITGVCRGEGAPAREVETPGRDDDRWAAKPVKEKKPPPRPQPTPELPVSSPPYPVRCTVRGPDPAKDDPGQIIEATYMITGNVLRVFVEDRMLGTATVQPGDDLEAAARAVIRENHGHHGAFYDPISYRGSVV